MKGCIAAITFQIAFFSAGFDKDSEARPDNEPLEIQRINTPPRLDGIIDEAAWLINEQDGMKY